MKAGRQEKVGVYIIGAGLAGVTLLAEIQRNKIYDSIISFLDDDSKKIGHSIAGVPVQGPIDGSILSITPQSSDIAIIAIPSASRERVKKIFLMLKRQQFRQIKVLPDIEHIIEGSTYLVQAKEIDLKDLLLRPAIQIDRRESTQYLQAKKVLVTGAGGSIGGELSRQLLLYARISHLYLLGHGENSIYEIDRELRLLQQGPVGKQTTIVPIIGELQDPDDIHSIISQTRPDVIFHAAAYKHVPMLEENPVAAVKNNLFGSLHILNAINNLTDVRFVLISTDKVVEPSSVYGASKRLAEELVLAEGQRQQHNHIMVVRFGNVLGSRGSIVPLFKQQIASGGPLTITHPDMRRFFMAISEAVGLVLAAGGGGKSGDLYTLDMGEPVVIREMAEQMIRFYGFRPNNDILLEYIGMRPGEKLEECLHEKGEVCTPSDVPGITHVVQRGFNIPIQDVLAELRPICYLDPQKSELYRNGHALRSILAKYISRLRSEYNDAAG